MFLPKISHTVMAELWVLHRPVTGYPAGRGVEPTEPVFLLIIGHIVMAELWVLHRFSNVPHVSYVIRVW